MTRTQYTDEVLQALAYLRVHAAVDARASVKAAFDKLDNAGVFADLDEQVDYASAEDIMAEVASRAAAHSRDEFEHAHGYGRCTCGRGDCPSPAPRVVKDDHTHIFNTPHSDELCAGDQDCILTYGEYRAYDLGNGPQKVYRPGDHIHNGCGLDCNR